MLDGGFTTVLSALIKHDVFTAGDDAGDDRDNDLRAENCEDEIMVIVITTMMIMLMTTMMLTVMIFGSKVRIHLPESSFAKTSFHPSILLKPVISLPGN